MPLKYAKPIKRRTVKAKKDRAEGAVKRAIRAQCVERDGWCRLSTDSWENHPDDWHEDNLHDDCDGPSEWMHLGDQKRARTRGMAPARRHTTQGSLMGCRQLHRAYDAGRVVITALTVQGADGPLKFQTAGSSVRREA